MNAIRFAPSLTQSEVAELHRVAKRPLRISDAENKAPNKKLTREKPVNAALLERLLALETQVRSLEITTALLNSQLKAGPASLERVQRLEVLMEEARRASKRRRNHDFHCRAQLVELETRVRSLEGVEPCSKHLSSLDLMDDYDVDEDSEPEQGAAAMLMEGSGYWGL